MVAGLLGANPARPGAAMSANISEDLERPGIGRARFNTVLQNIDAMKGTFAWQVFARRELEWGSYEFWWEFIP
jgi:S-adenosylmethionine:diacylglycerol 3-amino-3-carboxypropyl transferase